MSAGLNFFEMILFIGIHIENFTEQNLDILTIEDNYHLHQFWDVDGKCSCKMVSVCSWSTAFVNENK